MLRRQALPNSSCGGIDEASKAPIARYFPPSFATDLWLLLTGLRPVIRSRLTAQPTSALLRQWARRNGLFMVVDEHGYFTLSSSGLAARRALKIDSRAGRHTIALGLALGYPRCCSLAAGRHGDENLDAWAQEVALRRYPGFSQLISPDGYLRGKALLSHVPCSSRCRTSLTMAARAMSAKDQRKQVLLPQ